MAKATGFKEASYIEGKLVRIAKRKIEVESEDEETGQPALLTIRLGDDVDIDLDTVGEEVKAIIVDGKAARITRLSPKSREKPRRESYEASSSSNEVGTDLTG
jgi:hypothetical protein